MLAEVMVVIARHARWIPECLVRGCFLLAADVGWLLRPAPVRQLERTLSRVVRFRDGAASRSTVRRLSRRSMRSYFTYFSEAMTIGARTDEQLSARIRGAGPGLARLSAAAEHGSAPIAMGHLGNWDYAGRWGHLIFGTVITVAERLKDPELLHVFIQIRTELGITILLADQPRLTSRLVGALRTRHTVVPLLADRDLSRRGVFVKAFGSYLRVAAGGRSSWSRCTESGSQAPQDAGQARRGDMSARLVNQLNSHAFGACPAHKRSQPSARRG